MATTPMNGDLVNADRAAVSCNDTATLSMSLVGKLDIPIRSARTNLVFSSLSPKNNLSIKPLPKWASFITLYES